MPQTLEAALWCAIAVTLPLGARWLEPRLPALWRAPIAESRNALPVLYAFFPAYPALLFGSISGRDAGLYGLARTSWLIGGGLTLGLALAAWIAAQRPELPDSLRLPLADLLPLPRWALYWASGRLWLGNAWLGALAALALIALEWGLPMFALDRRLRWDARQRVLLAEAVMASAIFAVSSSFWATLVAYASPLAVLALVRPSTEASAEGRPE